MAKKIRIGTFNCENLFARYKFKTSRSVENISKEGWDVNDTKFGNFNKTVRSLTGQTIKKINADVIALQEVENLEVLRRFRTKFLGGSRNYPHAIVIDSYDPRKIDVAVLSRYPITHIRTHHDYKNKNNSRVFSRDCLEVDIDFKGDPITLYINHFKSMMGGRKKTRARRMDQAKAVKAIIKKRFGTKAGKSPFIMLGDLNDYMKKDSEGLTSLSSIVNWNQVENVVGRLKKDMQWTHFYPRKKSYNQLDYILVSSSLAKKVTKVAIERRGIPKRAVLFTGKRFKNVGHDNPKASDHCPVVIELKI